MSIFDVFEPITDQVLYDLNFYRVTKWYAWASISVENCIMYIIQYNRVDINDNPIGIITLFGSDIQMKFTDIFSKQDLRVVISECFKCVKNKHKNCKIDMR